MRAGSTGLRPGLVGRRTGLAQDGISLVRVGESSAEDGGAKVGASAVQRSSALAPNANRDKLNPTAMTNLTKF